MLVVRRFCRCRPDDEDVESEAMPEFSPESVPALELGKCQHDQTPWTRYLLSNSYSVDGNEELGKGAFSTVYKIQHRKTRRFYAVKTFHLDNLEIHGLQSVESEIAICRQVQSTYTNKLLDVIYEEQSIHLILDLCTGGDLRARVENFWKDVDRVELLRMTGVRLRGLPTKVAAMYVWQMLSAVAYMHSCHIMHRDVKLEHCMLKTDEQHSPLQLIDFSHACSFKEGERQTEMAGTLLYMAPEVLFESYDEKCDIWSIGVCCFIMCMGYDPFAGEHAELMENIAAGYILMSKIQWEHHYEMLAVTEALMTREFENRPSALEMMTTHECLKICSHLHDETCTVS